VRWSRDVAFWHGLHEALRAVAFATGPVVDPEMTRGTMFHEIVAGFRENFSGR
jgi:hypothetical protein